MPSSYFFIEPFIGGGGMTRHAVKCGKFSEFLCSDANDWIIHYYNELKYGWLPRENYWPDDYERIRDAWKKQDFNEFSKAEMILVGHCMSLYGFFMNKQRYIGPKSRIPHKYPIINAKKDLMWVNLVKISNSLYDELVLPDNPSVIYCDPPYLGTSGYLNVPEFDHDKFYEWVRLKSKIHYVYISESKMPDDFTCIWSRKLGGNGKISRSRVEKLFIHKEGLAMNYNKSNNLFD